MARRAKQLVLPIAAEVMRPKHIHIVPTDDLDLTTDIGAEVLVRRMLAVPLDQSILLDYLEGYKPGDSHTTEDHAEFHRLQALLNSRYRSRRFDFLGNSLTAWLFRESIRQMPEFLGRIIGCQEDTSAEAVPNR